MLIRQVLQNKDTKKWAYIEYSDENPKELSILGDKEFDGFMEAVEWSKGFEYNSYTYVEPNKEKHTFPRRNQINLLTPEEKLIYDAIKAVDKLRASLILTDVITKLNQAKELLGDYIDHK
jgi:hypothetical protein